MKEVQKRIEDFYGKNEKGVFNTKEIELLRKLEGKKYSLLLKEEKLMRLKSRALWLEAGDKNTKYFHKYASHRKNINTIFEIINRHGNLVRSFKIKKKEGWTFFETSSKNQKGVQF